MSRGALPIAARRLSSCGRVQPAFRYSTTVGSAPEARIIARVLREVPQAGLWKMVMVMGRVSPVRSQPKTSKGEAQGAGDLSATMKAWHDQ
jgi:hypothetical protein